MLTRTRKSSTRTRRAGASALPAGIAILLALTACGGEPGTGGSTGAEQQSKTVTLIVHDSFGDADAFSAAAKAATGYDVKVITAGDGGELTNKLVLTTGAPIADAFFGVDNAFASRLIDSGAVAPFAPARLPGRAGELSAQLLEDPSGQVPAGAKLPMVPVDFGATCVNVDTGWFEEHGIAPPKTYEDLADPRYRDLTVLIDPTTSSTGAAFLIGTVSAFGESGFADYWTRLMKNGVRIESGWTDAYNGQFTQGGGEGTHPVVLSYSTSPAWTLSDDGETSTTRALLETCTTQVEYAGVLKGASNPTGAQAVVDYLLSREFQDTIAETMYMYPVDTDASLPAEWKRFAAMPTAPHDLTPTQIGEGRERWLKAWSAATE